MNIKDIDLIYEPHNKIISDRAKVPVLPVCQKSIDKVIAVLRRKIIVTTKNIVLLSGLAKSTVLRVIHHLKTQGSISVDITRIGKAEIRTVCYISYSRPIEIVKKEYEDKTAKIKLAREQAKKRKAKTMAINEYKEGGVTMKTLAKKYGVNISSLQALISSDRGSNKRKAKSINKKIINLAPINGNEIELRITWRVEKDKNYRYINSPPKATTLDDVIDIINNCEFINKGKLIKASGFSQPTIDKALVFLIENKIIKKTSTGKSKGCDMFNYKLHGKLKINTLDGDWI